MTHIGHLCAWIASAPCTTLRGEHERPGCSVTDSPNCRCNVSQRRSPGLDHMRRNRARASHRRCRSSSDLSTKPSSKRLRTGLPRVINAAKTCAALMRPCHEPRGRPSWRRRERKVQRMTRIAWAPWPTALRRACDTLTIPDRVVAPSQVRRHLSNRKRKKSCHAFQHIDGNELDPSETRSRSWFEGWCSLPLLSRVAATTGYHCYTYAHAGLRGHHSSPPLPHWCCRPRAEG
jgi:hypothetical protein